VSRLEPTAVDEQEALREFRVSDWYTPFPRQQEFHLSNAKYRLFGGAAGPGKTKALLYEAIYQAHLHPGVDTLLLRRTFPELEASLITYFRRDVPRELYEKYNEAKHIVTWLNGSTTRFAYCDTENDVYRYQGAEYLFIGVDELTHFTLKQWQFLTSRNRCRIKAAKPCMAGATNPGNIGHAWVKALWVDRVPAPGMDRPDQYDPKDYAFIKATIADNPYFAQDDQYKKRSGNCPKRCGARFSTASGTFTPGSTSTFLRRGGTRCGPSKCSSSPGRRAGSRLTGDSSTRARSTGTRHATTASS